MTNLDKYRYTKEQYIVWKKSFFKAIKKAYKEKRLSKNAYTNFRKDVNEGLKNYNNGD
jgi:hypothetical protein